MILLFVMCSVMSRLFIVLVVWLVWKAGYSGEWLSVAAFRLAQRTDDNHAPRPGGNPDCAGTAITRCANSFTERLKSIAVENTTKWVLSVVCRDLGFDDMHAVTLPELCWWMVRNDLAEVLPESAAREALRMPKAIVQSATRESEIVPSVPATSIVQDKAKKVLALRVDPESPESFMLRPKRRRWVNERYTRWVKSQPCACCGKQADDPHHLIGHGQGGMGTKAHDLFVLPLCRTHHNELHADTVAFEEKYGSQLELIFRFIDRALAIGALA
ncbi:putative cytoplasmic protein [Salmonella enterica subsp. enterica]|uniref:Putative cytoplasmic protein n=1 Tax=Salmonella enterica I TaxID=59201 RepID=A0A379WVC4_SALET|nr:putative cytoplasmic protein [Salmonella enterica subsp. enterica]